MTGLAESRSSASASWCSSHSSLVGFFISTASAPTIWEALVQIHLDNDRTGLTKLIWVRRQVLLHIPQLVHRMASTFSLPIAFWFRVVRHSGQVNLRNVYPKDNETSSRPREASRMGRLYPISFSSVPKYQLRKADSFVFYSFVYIYAPANSAEKLVNDYRMLGLFLTVILIAWSLCFIAL